MKPTPAGWPRLSSVLYCINPAAQIDWLCRALGFQARIVVKDDAGAVQHSELTYGGCVVMVSPEHRGPGFRFGAEMAAPTHLGGNTQSLMLYVDDCDAHCAQARAAGARIVAKPELHDDGPDHWADRSYGAIDPEGHLWWISQRVRG